MKTTLQHTAAAVLCIAMSPADLLYAQDILDPPPVTVNAAHDPMPFVPGSWTLVVLPDTQNYIDTKDPALLPGIFTQMCNWIVANKAERNIGLVVFEGDIVDNNDREFNGTPAYEWTLAKQAISVLDGEVPYILVTGNHDYGPGGSARDRKSALNRFFQPSDNRLNDPSSGGILAGMFEPGHLENTYASVDTGTRKLLVFSLEFGPRQRVVDWANAVARQPRFRRHSIVLATHAYLREGNLPDPHAPVSDDNLPMPYRADINDPTQDNKHNPHNYKLASINPDKDPVHDGEELWQQFVSRHRNFILVLNGHYNSGNDTGNKLPARPANPMNNDGIATTARQVSIGVHGNTVHEIVANYQFAANGGNGFLRLMEFLPDGKTVHVKTYSPFVEASGHPPWLTDLRHQFTLTLSGVSENDKTHSKTGKASSTAPK
jgi:hypothetical protein